MFRNKKLLKAFAVFFLVEMLVSTALPSISYALTAGPTSPEATSFEPVDTTDMVNTLTGDFVYNLPLLEVPGPSGGLPLSLSYHAGIMTDEEASWVGLGWTLNPGAITRNVNGFADDHKDVEQTTRFYWDGYESHTVSIGVKSSAAGEPGVTAGLSVGYDSYRGFGVGGFVNLNIGLTKVLDPVKNKMVYPKGGPGGTFGFGFDPWGNPNMSVGLNAQINDAALNAQLSAGVGLSTNFKSVSMSVSGSKGLLDVSMSTDGSQVSSSSGIGGLSVNNGSRGRVSTRAVNYNLPIPFLHLGYSYQRQWIDEMEEVKTNGILHNPTGPVDIEDFVKKAFDSYSIGSNYSLASNKNPATEVKGTLPAYDDYRVNAQGVSGSFKPHLLKAHMYRQSIRQYDQDEEDYDMDIIHLPTQKTFPNTPVKFRFINDFSNKHQYNSDDFTLNTTNENDVPFSFEFSTASKTGEFDSTGIINDYLVGSKHIRQYTNAEIKNDEPGFIETKSTGFVRGDTPDDQIGGFQIVNESGVTYHFSLPAYSRDEFFYSEDKSDVETFNYSYKPERYAYTWYLTAITGPDYVDRGVEGISEDDWGYWVELEYGKWSDQYAWRNPGELSQNDLDQKFRNFSDGLKEVYYLDAIRTKTHTALFVKDMRSDGKSAIRVLKNKIDLTDIQGEDRPLYAPVSQNKNGGYLPKALVSKKEERVDLTPIYDTDLIEETFYTAKPVSSLKLDRIILLENSSSTLQNLDKTDGSLFSQSMVYTTKKHANSEETDKTVTQHLPDNVLDVGDISGSVLYSEAIRIIKLNTDDETLCPETANSFTHSSLSGSGTASTNTSNYVRRGKLALNSIEFLGKAGVSVIPPINFQYELSNPVTGSGTLSVVDTDLKRYSLTNSSVLQLGDIVKFSNSGTDYFASIYKTGSTAKVQIIGKNTPSAGTINWATTKNPPYNKESHDEWGFFKGDYYDIDNPNIDRIRTNTSKNHVDAWSLREIQTSLGGTIKINHESDIYQKAVVSGSYPLVIATATFPEYSSSSNLSTITFEADADAGEYFFEGSDKVSLLMIYTEVDVPNGYRSGEECIQDLGNLTYKTIEIDGSITEINGNQIKINSICLANFFGFIYRDDSGEYPSCLESSGSGNPNARGNPPGEEDDLPGGCKRGYVHRVFLEGNLLIYNPDFDVPGGDLRTVSIAVEDPFTERSNKTLYSYQDQQDLLRSSGVTSYAPKAIDKYSNEIDEIDDNTSAAVTDFKLALYNSYSTIISKSSELPAPGVMYQYAKIQEAVKNQGEADYKILPNYTVYQFRMFDENTVQFEEQEAVSGSALSSVIDELTMADQDGYNLEFSESSTNRIAKKMLVKNYSARIGELQSVALYDNSNKKISETINQYLHDDPDFETELESRFNNQGRIDETFADARAVRKGNKFAMLASLTQTQYFPSIQVSQTTINYKTGIKSVSENVAFDFYNGNVTKTISTDGHGNRYMTKSIPAYRKYGAMGFAANGGKNMLSQETAGYSYKVGKHDTIPVGLMSATVQTWSNAVNVLDQGTQTSIWRKHASFSFIGDDSESLRNDGLYPLTSNQLPEFTAWHKDDLITENWQRNAELTLYDVYSHALEVSDLNNDFAATKMSRDQTAVSATVSNAKYKEFCFSGAENGFDSNGKAEGGVDIAGSISSTAHTGKSGISAASGFKSFGYTINAPELGTYKVQVWADHDNTTKIKHKLNNVLQTQPPITVLGQAGSWYLLEASIPITSSYTSLEIWCEAYGSTTIYDDFRVRPADAAMLSYVYNKWGELSHILDNNNLYSRFEYDAAGRLKASYRETLKRGDNTYGKDGLIKVSEVIYNYGKNN